MDDLLMKETQPWIFFEVDVLNASTAALSMRIVTVNDPDITLMDREERYLAAKDYPALAKVWDNADDAIFDNL